MGQMKKVRKVVFQNTPYQSKSNLSKKINPPKTPYYYRFI